LLQNNQASCRRRQSENQAGRGHDVGGIAPNQFGSFAIDKRLQPPAKVGVLKKITFKRDGDRSPLRGHRGIVGIALRFGLPHATYLQSPLQSFFLKSVSWRPLRFSRGGEAPFLFVVCVGGW